MIPTGETPGQFYLNNQPPFESQREPSVVQSQITGGKPQAEVMFLRERTITQRDETTELVRRVRTLKQAGDQGALEELLFGNERLMAEAYRDASGLRDFRLLNEMITLPQAKWTQQYRLLPSHGALLLKSALTSHEYAVVEWIFSHPEAVVLFHHADQAQQEIIQQHIWNTNSSEYIAQLFERKIFPVETFQQQLTVYLEHGCWDMVEKLHFLLKGTPCEGLVIETACDVLRQYKMPEKTEQSRGMWWPELCQHVMSKVLGSDDIELLDGLMAVVPRLVVQGYGIPFRHCGLRWLRKAIENHCCHVVKGLMLSDRAGFWIETLDEQGNTLLHRAVIAEHKGLAASLLPCSNIHTKNDAGLPPYELARLKGLEWWQLLAPAQTAPSLTGTVRPPGPREPSPCVAPAQRQAPCPSVPMNQGWLGMQDVGVLLQLQVALKNNDYQSVGAAHVALGRFSDRPVPGYGNVSYLVMNQELLLQTTYVQFCQYPGAYLYMINQNVCETYTKVEPVIQGDQPLTDNSKLVIAGHGPNMGGMNGEQFAVFLNKWLQDNGCPEGVCPNITLSSCKTACSPASIDPVLYLFDGMELYHENSFVEDFVTRMAIFRRFPKVTASSSTVTTYGDGKELCAHYEQQRNTRRIIRWQGSSMWLSRELAERHGYTNITAENYDDSIIRVYRYDQVQRKVISQPKHPKPLSSTMNFGGLMSLRPPPHH